MKNLNRKFNWRTILFTGLAVSLSTLTAQAQFIPTERNGSLRIENNDSYYINADYTDHDGNLILRSLYPNTSLASDWKISHNRTDGSLYFGHYSAYYGGGYSYGIKMSRGGNLDIGGRTNFVNGSYSSGTDGRYQQLFSYHTGNYAHALRTRHDAGNDNYNAIDFYTWQLSDGAANNGSKHGLTILHGKVGIGNIKQPDNTLDVNGGVDINDYIRHNGDENTHIGFSVLDQIALRTNGVDRMTIYPSGNVGIGTNTTPAYRLKVRGPFTSRSGGLHLVHDNGTEGIEMGYSGIQKTGTGSLTIDGVANGVLALQSNSNGNVGIGTSNVGAKLHVYGGEVRFQGTDVTSHFFHSLDENTYIRGGKTNSKVIINDTGTNTGVGTSDPKSKLHIKVASSGQTFNANDGLIVENNGTADSYAALQVATGSGKVFTVTDAGNSFLTGTFNARNVHVDPDLIFPDYVFEDSYELQSLDQVEAFIETNHHLPEVPSAQQIKDEGYDVANMDAILLKKIEELTLHMIEIKKENAELRAKLDGKRRRK